MLLHDIRQAVRWLRGNPGLAVSALLIFALGIGSVTATFTVIHAVLLRPLPFDSPERLIRIWSSPAGRNLPFFSVSAPDVEDWRARAATLAQVAPYERQAPVTLSGSDADSASVGEEPDQVMAVRISREIFELLGVRPAIGRWFDDAEDRPGSGGGVTVISHGLWQRRFGGRRDAIGQTLQADGRRVAIIGVMPPGFDVPNAPAEMWLPLQLAIDPAKRDDRRLRVLARLRDGAAVDDAVSELTRIAADLAREHPKTNHTWTVTVRPLTDTVVGEGFRRALLMVGAAVGLVLLIACANIAGLLLSHATTRSREMSVRLALGASRVALVRQMLTETITLASAGGGCGVLLAMWTVDALERVAAGTVPRAAEIALRPTVLWFTCGVTMSAALLAGLAPALGTSRLRADALRGRHASSGQGTGRGRDLIVVGQVAVAMMLLVAAGLMTRSFLALQQRELGFTPANLLVLDVAPPAGTPRQPFYDVVTARLAAVPGVAEVATGSSLPFAGPNSANTVAIEGRTFPPGEAPDADYREVSPSYFRAMGIPVRRGRVFAAEGSIAAAGVLLSETAARQFFGGADPIGRHIRLGGRPWAVVTGVVADARYLGLDDPQDTPRPMVYVPAGAGDLPAATIVIRTAVPPETIVADVRRALAAAAPRQPIARLETMEGILRQFLGPQQFNTALLGAFAWIAVLFAAAGLWGLISHVVSRRAHEIGIRVALGARSPEVMRLTAGRGVVLALAGITLGLAGSLALTGVLRQVLFAVSPTDPATLAGVSLVFLVVGAGASFGPARRALRIDPAVALRSES